MTFFLTLDLVNTAHSDLLLSRAVRVEIPTRENLLKTRCWNRQGGFPLKVLRWRDQVPRGTEVVVDVECRVMESSSVEVSQYFRRPVCWSAK